MMWGGEPTLEISAWSDDFHDFNQGSAERWPHTMLATSTHDTKRSEDVRARINVLSEIPEDWIDAVRKWSRMNARWRPQVNGRVVPTPNEEYMLYQTLLGVWPLRNDEIASLPERLDAFIYKAAREAKTYTSWTRPDEAYESALIQFARAVIDKENSSFLRSFSGFQKRVAHFGALNALSQLTLKLTSPGVPDFYQGSEVWNLNLVDPDNRRAVDFELRETLLEHLLEKSSKPAKLLRDLLARWEDGRIKMYVMFRGLGYRRQEPALFERGEYIPLTVTGAGRRHVTAFARREDDRYSITVVPRLTASLIKPGKFPIGGSVWKQTRLALPAGSAKRWKNIFTDERVTIQRNGTVAVGDVLKSFPVAILASE